MFSGATFRCQNQVLENQVVERHVLENQVVERHVLENQVVEVTYCRKYISNVEI
jgi:hypothetical protein